MTSSLRLSCGDLPKSRSRVTIDLGGLLENVGTVRKALPLGVDLLPVIKSNAYGHGIVPVSQAMALDGLSRVAVMGVDEGCHLRDGGFEGQIVLLGGFSPEEISLCRRLLLTPVIHHADQVRALELAPSQGPPLGIHVKIDTGMGRLGFLPEDFPAALDRLAEIASVRIEGVMTHFPMAEDREDAARCRESLRATLASSLGHPALSGLTVVHMASSGAILSGEVVCDLPLHPSGRRLAFWARPGLLLYGHYPGPRDPRVPVRPIFGVEARLLSVRSLPRGSSVSYGRTVTLKRDSRIGILGMGYADGLPRLMSGKGWATISGRCAPFLGRVCMDMVAVDLTEIPSDEIPAEWVTLIDPENPLSLGVDRLAEEGKTIPYEILCLLGHRSERRYVGVPSKGADRRV